ncbi:GspH/FimT family pseudopilin [Massilia putida]|uniref:GspH/FimT family pseudopilin n=1 Tax=Massilia putida TaxID=1141883 RepID=UPI000950F93C|nr:GspH/FimT family pseudopilin [Massilia putida]
MVSRRRGRGFTMVELLAVVAITAILSAMAAPSFKSLVAGQRARSTATELYAALSLARSEAIKRDAQVTLQSLTGGWQAGWTIPNPTDTGHPVANHGQVAGATITGPTAVVYLPNGRVASDTAPSFDIAVDGASSHRCVQVDLSGRPRMQASGC